MSTRFTSQAAELLRDAIREAGGIEVFAVGQVDPTGRVTDLQIHCRGDSHSVPALLSRPRPGEVVIHNHPSGNLDPSPADLHLAGTYGEDGVGMVIVDSELRRDRWVVEPQKRTLQPVTEDEVRAFFTNALPRALPHFEARPGQVEMALSVARTLNEGQQPAVLEAGTGTGKSLAYLVPSVLWAVKNESRVVIATFTITLQAQLARSDLPILRRAGLEFRHAVLKGRGNYVCRRKLAEAQSDNPPEDLRALTEWASRVQDGSRSDFGFAVEDETWDRVVSDHDQTLRARCEHFADCFYYRARRRAADAHILVVNHHLLLADLNIKAQSGGAGILPRFDRAVIDEAHHLEDAATSLFQERVTARTVRRALAPLLPRRKRPGSLIKLDQRYAQLASPLDAGDREQVRRLLANLQRDLPELHADARDWMEQIASDAFDGESTALRLIPALRHSPTWTELLAPTLAEARDRLLRAHRDLSALDELLDTLPAKERLGEPQPLFDLARASRRVGDQARILSRFLSEEQTPSAVRWIGQVRERGRAPGAAPTIAPIEVGPLLRERVFDALSSVTLTSATLTVRGRFEHYRARVGLDHGSTAVFPSPFDYAEQAVLVLPRDVPPPSHADWQDAVARLTMEAIQAAGGGVFVLCTSYSLVRSLHARAQRELGPRFALFRQGQSGRGRLLESFRAAGDGVLFGTDSFWEGVSVEGTALRLVIIPRLPFRVPTEPIQQARYEAMEARGLNPFSGYSLPQAVLRLRQGTGRLIRTRRDRGAVLVLDRRILDQWYGRVFLQSLPPLQRITGPSRSVLPRLAAFLSG